MSKRYVYRLTRNEVVGGHPLNIPDLIIEEWDHDPMEPMMDKEGKGKRVNIYQYELDGLLSKIEELDGRIELIRKIFDTYGNYMDGINTMLESPATLVTHEMWQAIKKSVEGK